MEKLIIAGIVILVILYMTYPRFQRRRVSSARFFKGFPPPTRRQPKLRRGKLNLTLPFFLQLFVLLFLLAALLLSNKKVSVDQSKGLGVWFIVDTSASMSAIQEKEPRMNAASREVEKVIKQIQKTVKSKDVCFRLSGVDLERRDLLTEGDSFGVLRAVKNLKPRPLGTDLEIIRRLFQSMKTQTQQQSECRVSHVVVITDMPAPGWIGESGDIAVIWRDIGEPVDNVGFIDIHASRNPLTGLASEIKLEISVFGVPPTNAKLTVTGPDGANIKNDGLNLREGQAWEGSFTPSGPGQYRMQVSPGGAYSFDDTAVIQIGDSHEIRVDWRLNDRSLIQRMGWVEDKIAPHLRVTDSQTIDDNIPTLIVGPGYTSIENKTAEIRDFVEASSLLADVNLDAVESLGLQGIDLPGGLGLQPVLRGVDGKTLLAQSEKPLRVFVPGLPIETDDVKGRFTTAVFFNALRWLLQTRELPPLYTLTSPQFIEPSSNRLVLHKDEGNTGRVSQSSGNIEEIKPVTGRGKSEPLWPVLLMAAAILFLIERMINVFDDLLS